MQAENRSIKALFERIKQRLRGDDERMQFAVHVTEMGAPYRETVRARSSCDAVIQVLRRYEAAGDDRGMALRIFVSRVV